MFHHRIDILTILSLAWLLACLIGAIACGILFAHATALGDRLCWLFWTAELPLFGGLSFPVMFGGDRSC